MADSYNFRIYICVHTDLMKHYRFKKVYDRGFMVDLRRRHLRGPEISDEAAG